MVFIPDAIVRNEGDCVESEFKALKDSQNSMYD